MSMIRSHWFLWFVGWNISGIRRVKDSVWRQLLLPGRLLVLKKTRKNRRKNYEEKSQTWTILGEDKLERDSRIDQVSVIRFQNFLCPKDCEKAKRGWYVDLPYLCSHSPLEVRVELVQAPIHPYSDTPEIKSHNFSVDSGQIEIEKCLFSDMLPPWHVCKSIGNT